MERITASGSTVQTVVTGVELRLPLGEWDAAGEPFQRWVLRLPDDAPE